MIITKVLKNITYTALEAFRDGSSVAVLRKENARLRKNLKRRLATLESSGLSDFIDTGGKYSSTEAIRDALKAPKAGGSLESQLATAQDTLMSLHQLDKNKTLDKRTLREVFKNQINSNKYGIADNRLKEIANKPIDQQMKFVANIRRNQKMLNDDPNYVSNIKGGIHGSREVAIATWNLMKKGNNKPTYEQILEEMVIAGNAAGGSGSNFINSNLSSFRNNYDNDSDEDNEDNFL